MWDTHLFLTPSMNSGMFSIVPISLNILSTAYNNKDKRVKLPTSAQNKVWKAKKSMALKNKYLQV